MPGYTKLFNSIVASTIWRESDHVRIVWITMLAMSDRRGNVEASVPGLADLARVSVEKCREAITVLESPDVDSRDSDNEGRRIGKVQGGWVILNYLKYRNKLSSAERREYKTIKQREYRAKSQVDNTVDTNSTGGLSGHIAEADAEATNTNTTSKSLARCARIKTSWPDGFSLSEKMREFSLDRGLVPEQQFDAFKDYHQSRGNRFVDWVAAWRTWCRNAAAYAQRSKNGESLSKHEQRQKRTLEAYKRSVERDRHEVGSTVRPALPSGSH